MHSQFLMLRGNCWCCGSPRALMFHADGTTETCLGKSEFNKDRCTGPCKYVFVGGLCKAGRRTDGNCRGVLLPMNHVRI